MEPTGLSVTNKDGRTIQIPRDVEVEGGAAIEAFVREQLNQPVVPEPPPSDPEE